MFQISEVQEAPAFNGRPSCLGTAVVADRFRIGNAIQRETREAFVETAVPRQALYELIDASWSCIVGS
jgi:hypothetical protein